MRREEFDQYDHEVVDPDDFEATLEALLPLGLKFYCRPGPSPEVYGPNFWIGEEGEDWHNLFAALSPEELLEVIREGRAWLKAIGREVDDDPSSN